MLQDGVETERHEVMRAVAEGAGGNEEDGPGFEKTVGLGGWVGGEAMVEGGDEIFVGGLLVF